MKDFDTITVKGETFVLVPQTRFEALASAADDTQDVAAARASLAELAKRPNDLLSIEDLAEIEQTGPLTFWRKRRGMTAISLAREAQISAGYLSEIENGKKDGGIRVMRKIAGILAVSLDDLV